MTIALPEHQLNGIPFLDARADYFKHVEGTFDKWSSAERAAQELEHLALVPGAGLRILDGGVGTGDILEHILAEADERFPEQPFRILCKEISGADISKAIQKLGWIFEAHPATVVFATNLKFAQAAELICKPEEQANLVRKTVELEGRKTATFNRQLAGLEDFIGDNWGTYLDVQNRPQSERPVILAIHRADQHRALRPVLENGARDGHDFIIASQPYRSISPAETKVKNVIGPLVKSLRRGGRLIGVHASGEDGGHAVIRRLAQIGGLDFADGLFRHNDARAIFDAAQRQLGQRASEFRLSVDVLPLAYGFKPHLSEMPGFGDSVYDVAWNSTIYNAQLDTEQTHQLLKTGRHKAVTREMLSVFGRKAFFHNQAFSISRAPA